jgi:hypothetical protein
MCIGFIAMGVGIIIEKSANAGIGITARLSRPSLAGNAERNLPTVETYVLMDKEDLASGVADLVNHDLAASIVQISDHDLGTPRASCATHHPCNPTGVAGDIAMRRARSRPHKPWASSSLITATGGLRVIGVARRERLSRVWPPNGGHPRRDRRGRCWANGHDGPRRIAQNIHRMEIAVAQAIAFRHVPEAIEQDLLPSKRPMVSLIVQPCRSR